MELVFLVVLIVLMVAALGAGYPVAFSLPGSAVLTIVLAAVFGYLFEGRVDAYFYHGNPLQWLNAGVTNFRGIYWQAERDTLIAIPLFIFMGIMLERSKIAEDLLVTMAQLFGPLPGGLGISVVLVGTLLAATTGIVGATVVAMGLISLPVMLRNNYSHALATGTINASGTLGQIIPPSIVLIILADQLSNATDQAASLRTAEYKLATGNSVLPPEFGIVSTSAGDMFLGAFLPGMVLVGLYIAYILTFALLRPKLAPAAPFKGSYDRKFVARVVMVLVPPLTLIFVVLGSIVMGIATVNQAGSIGAIGAMIMAGYRLMEGKRGAYYPAILALVSVVVLAVILRYHSINVKNIVTQADVIAVILAAIASFTLLVAIIWSGWRAFRFNSTLQGVMLETAKTTSLVFIILIGAAMLTSAFRAFGGEDLVRDFLSGLPGGFISKFVVVMAVIFFLGFFLDFIEIAVVVVPIIAPILLADPSANITAVWLGVMIGVNMQTSFLTPPFGFALFYLRGVAPAVVRTISMYKGVVPYIILQLVGLAIVGFYPKLVNYLPNKVYLTSETAPPPRNPRLQACLEEYLFDVYERDGAALRTAIAKARTLDLSYLPKEYQSDMSRGLKKAEQTFDLVKAVTTAAAAVNAYKPTYRPLHTEMRDIRVELDVALRRLNKLNNDRRNLAREDNADKEELGELDRRIEEMRAQVARIRATKPEGWDEINARFRALAAAETKARRAYRRNVDDAYEPLPNLIKTIGAVEALAALKPDIEALGAVIARDDPQTAIAAIKDVTRPLNKIAGVDAIRSNLSNARRALRKGRLDRVKSAEFLAMAMDAYNSELAWRRRAQSELVSGLVEYDKAIRGTIGIRGQEQLSRDQANAIAGCQSVHRDISLSF